MMAAERLALQLPPRRRKNCQNSHDLARRRRSAASACSAAAGLVGPMVLMPDLRTFPFRLASPVPAMILILNELGCLGQIGCLLSLTQREKATRD